MKERGLPIVVALGGNAISPPGEIGNITQQFVQTRTTCRVLAELIEQGERIIITHGNGPQVGNAVRRVELSAHEVYPLDLGICVADLQGGMGYMIAQSLINELHHREIDRTVSSLVTSVLIDPNDPAMENPTKPIGLFYSQEDAHDRMDEYGWNMVEMPNHEFRRVVPSPLPNEIIEIDSIRALLDADHILVTVGGGGVPVYRDHQGDLQGLEAVIDKDLASALLAREINAETFIILTPVDAVCLDFGKETQRSLRNLTLIDAQKYLDEGQFPAGSMGPKIEAAIDFLQASNLEQARVVICDIDDCAAALAGDAGTTITRE